MQTSDDVKQEISNETQRKLYKLVQDFDWEGVYTHIRCELSFDIRNVEMGMHPLEPEHVLSIWDDEWCVEFRFNTTLSSEPIVGQDVIRNFDSGEIGIVLRGSNQSVPWCEGLRFLRHVQLTLGLDEVASQESLLDHGIPYQPAPLQPPKKPGFNTWGEDKSKEYIDKG